MGLRFKSRRKLFGTEWSLTHISRNKSTQYESLFATELNVGDEITGK